MEKLFVYNVNGAILEDTEAFGKAWREAKEIATKEHCAITRQFVCGNEIINEFYAKCGCFINDRHYDINSVKVF